MKAMLTIAILALVAGTVVAETVVVNFDDLGGLMPVPPGYGGIASWNNWASTSGDANYIPLSDPNVAINIGAPTPIEFGQEVVLQGFSFTGPSPGVLPVHFKLMLAGAAATPMQLVLSRQEF